MPEDAFIQRIAQHLDVEDEAQAREVARTVLLGVHLQLPEDAARSLESSMPAWMRDLWTHPREDLKAERGSHTRFARHQFIDWVADHTGVGDPYMAERAIREVSAALREEVPESDRIVRDNVSEGIRELWVGKPSAPAPGPPR